MLDCALVAAALKVTLANRGVLDDIKARIRAEVFSAIESQTVPFPPCPPCPIDPRSPTPLLGRSKPALTLAPQDERKPEPPREVFLINELIREYLEFQGYSHTLSVFLPESAQPAHRCDSSLLARELGVPPAAAAAEMCAPPSPWQTRRTLYGDGPSHAFVAGRPGRCCTRCWLNRPVRPLLPLLPRLHRRRRRERHKARDATGSHGLRVLRQC